MRTTQADLATPARIRLAAIDLFGREGFGVGLRAIAEEAGVSLSLIRHHFGSKAGLREACDVQILREIREAKEDQFLGDDPSAKMHNLATIDRYSPLMRYLFQAMREGGTVAREFFDRMVTDAEEYTEKAVVAGVIVPSRDPGARARFLSAAVLGGALLTHLLGEDSDPQRSMRRWLDEMTPAALELYTYGLFNDSTMLDTYLKYMKDPPGDGVTGA